MTAARDESFDRPDAAGDVAGEKEVFLSLSNVSKRFGGVTALKGVDLELRRGEVLGLLGDNGAGKTTLVKVIAGVHEPEEGEIRCRGEPVRITNPTIAHQLGIETVYQDLALIPNLEIADNFYIGREETLDLVPGLVRLLRSRRMERAAAETLDKLDIHIPSMRVSVDALSGGQRQAIAIARAIGWKANLVMLDEPTAALSVAEQNKVLELARRLAQENVAVLYITHNMNDALAVTDRIAVLYQGRLAGELTTARTNRNEVISLIMSGH